MRGFGYAFFVLEAIMSKNIRKTNYEMIRIFAMILIVIHHVFVHCINKQILNPDLCETSKLFNDFTIYKRLVITDYAYSFGKIGNILFILISGYFLIDKKIDISKQIIKIVSEMLFATFVLMIVSGIHLHFERIKTTLNIRMFNEGWWFTGYYISIILFAWLGLNSYLQKIDRTQYRNILLIMFAIVSIVWIRNVISKIGLDGIASGVFIYMLGGYIKKYDPFQKVNGWIAFLVIVFSFIVMGFSYYLYTANNINAAILGNKEAYNTVIGEYSEFSITCLAVGVSLFELIRRFKIKDSFVINYIASATFLIYLIHDNSYVHGLFYKIDWVDMIYNKEYGKLLLYLALIIIGIFILGVVLYSIYNLIMSLLHKLLK